MKPESPISAAAVQPSGSLIDAAYASGGYFADNARHSEDAAFKAMHFMRLFKRCQLSHPLEVSRYADVGCGSGDVAEQVAAGLRGNGHPVASARGYDVSPHAARLRKTGVEFVHGDFCTLGEPADLVTLFDVVEHVPDPIDFLKKVARRAGMIGLHIPLDASLNYAARDKFRARLHDPGHLSLLTAAGALNLLTMAGLRPLDYLYTFGFETPSGRSTWISKASIPFKWLLARLNPWLFSITLGGASLMVIAKSYTCDRTDSEI